MLYLRIIVDIKFTTTLTIATGTTNAGISIIRISGKDAFFIADSIFVSKKGNKKISEQKSHTMHYGMIMENDVPVLNPEYDLQQIEKLKQEQKTLIQCSVESCSDLKRCTISEVSVILYTTVPELILRGEKHE